MKHKLNRTHFMTIRYITTVCAMEKLQNKILTSENYIF